IYIYIYIYIFHYYNVEQREFLAGSLQQSPPGSASSDNSPPVTKVVISITISGTLIHLLFCFFFLNNFLCGIVCVFV
ncbi:hypothetical protein PanWU01x14_041740, partial [Parasponia andersonii]